MISRCVCNQSRYVGWWESERESVNTLVSVPSDGAEEAVRETHLWQHYSIPKQAVLQGQTENN